MIDRYRHLADQERRLYEAVPPVDPAPLHWMSSDATFSYCWPCARKAAWEELGKEGEPPAETEWWKRDPVEEGIRDRIDGGFDSSPSDSPESCEACGCTLRHTLTDYGVEAELAHFTEQRGFQVVGPEQTYEISRICLDLTWEGAPADQVEAAIVIVEDALKVAIKQGGAE